MKREIFIYVLVSILGLFALSEANAQQKGSGILYFGSQSEMDNFVMDTVNYSEFALRYDENNFFYRYNRLLRIWEPKGGNIYNQNGSLTSNRTFLFNDYNLFMQGTGSEFFSLSNVSNANIQASSNATLTGNFAANINNGGAGHAGISVFSSNNYVNLQGNIFSLQNESGQSKPVEQRFYDQGSNGLGGLFSGITAQNDVLESTLIELPDISSSVSEGDVLTVTSKQIGHVSLDGRVSTKLTTQFKSIEKDLEFTENAENDRSSANILFDFERNGFFVKDTLNSQLNDTSIIVVNEENKRYRRVFTGAVNADWFGANPNDEIDDTYAIQKAIRYVCLNNPEFNNSGQVNLSSGKYIVDNNVLFLSVSGAINNQFGLKIKGESNGATEIEMKETGLEESYFFNSLNSTTRRIARCYFEDITFIGEGKEKTIAFKVISGGHEQSFNFENCRFLNMNTAFFATGSASASENRFRHTKFRNIKTVAVFDNSQSVNNTFEKCDAELIDSTFFIVTNSGGMELDIDDGSYISSGDTLGSGQNTYLIEVRGSSSVNGNASFKNIKTEHRNEKSGVAKLTNNTGTANLLFDNCHFFQTGGSIVSRSGFEVEENKTIKLTNCKLNQNFLEFNFNAGSGTTERTFSNIGSIFLDKCEVSENIFDLVSNSTYKNFKITDCYSSEVAANANVDYKIALNYDSGQGGRSTSNVEEYKIRGKWSNEFWPFSNTAANEHIIKLPPNVTITNIYVFHPSGGNPTADTYKIKVGNDDKSTVYVEGDIIDQNSQQIIDEDVRIVIGEDINERKVRLWAGDSPLNDGNIAKKGGDFIITYICN